MPPRHFNLLSTTSSASILTILSLSIWTISSFTQKVLWMNIPHMFVLFSRNCWITVFTAIYRNVSSTKQQSLFSNTLFHLTVLKWNPRASILSRIGLFLSLFMIFKSFSVSLIITVDLSKVIPELPCLSPPYSARKAKPCLSSGPPPHKKHSIASRNALPPLLCCVTSILPCQLHSIQTLHASQFPVLK